MTGSHSTAALMEYRFDFDPCALGTTAVQGEDGAYILSGEKAFVPYAAEAAAFLVYANLDRQSQGFIVPATSQGLSISAEREKLMGLRALPLYRLTLSDVRVPAENRLGGVAGHDFSCLLASMQVAQAARRPRCERGPHSSMPVTMQRSGRRSA